MNLTLLAWLIAFLSFSLLSLRNAVWGVSLYMLTFFMAPPYWWWGALIARYRWNLYSGLILLGSTLIGGGLASEMNYANKVNRRFFWLAFLIVANATAVHFLLAPNLAISSVRYILMFKMIVLFTVMVLVIRTENDLKIVVLSIVLGASYIGYEVTINERGKVSGNRLEGVGVANASSANDLACLMVSSVPLVAPLFLFGGWEFKAVAVIAGPFILNVILKCNSRGAFIALIMLGFIYLFASPKSIRPQVIKIICLGILAGWLLLGDPRIVERFMTTFSAGENRDNSAESRLNFWKAGFMMLADHPLGAGGDGFKDVYGVRYIAKVTGDATARSVHQGYINEACEWGLQGLLLRLLVLIGGLRLAWKTAKRAVAVNLLFVSGVALSVVAGLSGLLVQSFFGTFLDDEWGLWLVAIALGCNRLVTIEEETVIMSETESTPRHRHEDVSQ